MKNPIFVVLPCCVLLNACVSAPQNIPDISHARVWHAENGLVRATTGQVPVYSPNLQNNIQAATPVYVQPSANYVAPNPTYSQNPIQAAAPIYTNQVPAVQNQVQPVYTANTASAPVIDLGDASPITTFSRYKNDDFLPLIMQAENQSSGYVKSILAKSREMTLYHKEIIEGGCWDYLDAAWTRAGVGRNMRQTVYKSTYGGAYTSVDSLRTGDWIYHVNHSYKNIEHSGMFIGWVDKNRHLGLTLSYAGEGRKEPARYKVYDLSSVYNIMRAPS